MVRVEQMKTTQKETLELFTKKNDYGDAYERQTSTTKGFGFTQ